MTKYIKAPFNFVPLNEKVFTQTDMDLHSVDLPAEDSESGYIDLELKALTPVFIRDGKARDETGKNDVLLFSQVDDGGVKKHFIPGTTLKGMFRNVLEIITEGYIRMDSKMKFSQRDWEDKKNYTLMNPVVQTNMRCGWLVINEYGESILYDHGYPYRINHLQLDRFFDMVGINLSFEKLFSRQSKQLDLNKEQKINGKNIDPKNAAFKYAKLGGNTDKLENLNFSTDEDTYCLIKGKMMNPPAFTERRIKYDPNGDFTGTIVFTGQPDKWEDPRTKERKFGAGKFYEFVFPAEKRDEYKISKDIIDGFKFIYQESEAWHYFRKKRKIPVFFRTQKINQEEIVKDFGLALLYKLPYEKSALEVARKSQQLNEKEITIDLADKIFGSVSKDKVSNVYPFKGRVQFGHAFTVNTAEEDEPVIKRMGSPKPSYLPIYIDQSQLGKNGTTTNYLSYNNENALLSGWKRYPLHYDANKMEPEGEFNPQLDTVFKPLKKGTTFHCRIRFHNLKSFEVGAILSAITFHNNHKNLCHSIGFAKPYGFGKLKVNIAANTGIIKAIEDYLIEFENTMDEASGKKWIKQESLQELFTMAWDKNSAKDDLLLEYMPMSNDRDENHFYQAKKANEYLEKYSILVNKKYKATSLNEAYLKKKQEEKELEHEEKERQEKERIENERKIKEEEEKKRIRANQEKKVSKGLSVLENHCDLNRAKREVEQFLKLSDKELIPDEQIQFLFEFIRKFYLRANLRDKKDWDKYFNESANWKKVSGWVGEEKAKALYDDLIGK
jgi:CRISPR-associated protein (TIGR03986 family)